MQQLNNDIIMQTDFVLAQYGFNQYFPDKNVSIKIANFKTGGNVTRCHWLTAVDNADAISQINKLVADNYYVCRICGSIESKHWWKQTDGQSLSIRSMRNMVICYKCGFWCEKVVMHHTETDWKKKLVINGHHYMCSNPTTDNHGSGLGFSGRVFRVRSIVNGEEFSTNDLWHQGEIDAEFKELLPDNAEFLVQSEWPVANDDLPF